MTRTMRVAAWAWTLLMGMALCVVSASTAQADDDFDDYWKGYWKGQRKLYKYQYRHGLPVGPMAPGYYATPNNNYYYSQPPNAYYPRGAYRQGYYRRGYRYGPNYGPSFRWW